MHGRVKILILAYLESEHWAGNKSTHFNIRIKINFNTKIHKTSINLLIDMHRIFLFFSMLDIEMFL